MFVDAHVNEEFAKSVMIDTGATHNFISKARAKRLCLILDKDTGQMKAVN